MSMWRIMIKTRGIERKINERTLGEIQGISMESVSAIKMKLIGHIIRHNEIIVKIFEGKMQGKKQGSREIPRKRYYNVSEGLMIMKWRRVQSIERSGFGFIDKSWLLEVDDDERWWLFNVLSLFEKGVITINFNIFTKGRHSADQKMVEVWDQVFE